MTNINTGGPVYPSDCVYVNGVMVKRPFEGISLRDYFAGQALAGILTGGGALPPAAIATGAAVAYADALIAALGEGQ